MSYNSAYQAGLDLPDLEVHPRYTDVFNYTSIYLYVPIWLDLQAQKSKVDLTI